jgi:hypothetical protein
MQSFIKSIPSEGKYTSCPWIASLAFLELPCPCREGGYDYYIGGRLARCWQEAAASVQGLLEGVFECKAASVWDGYFDSYDFVLGMLKATASAWPLLLFCRLRCGRR